MTQSERIARIFELCDFQAALQQSSVSAMDPAMVKAYGWDSDLHP